MGKNSLLKSTSKKKKPTSEKKDEELKAKTKKKSTAAKKAKPMVKADKKVKAPVKAKVAPKAKGAERAEKPKKAKAAPKKATPKKTAVKTKAPAKKTAPKKREKISVKDLINKKFDTWKPTKVFTVSSDEEYLKNFEAPPFVTGSEEEIKRIKKLLLKKFDLEQIKAAAEKIAAEEAVIKKAAPEKEAEPDVSVTYIPPDDGDTIASDPMGRATKYMVAVFVVLFSLIIGTSILNHGKYYIKDKDGALEIWQGGFSPMGEELLIALPGVQPPETIKSSYLETDVFSIIFNYYVEKADMLLEVPGIPDFEGIKTYLNEALSYATINDSKKVYARLNNIELMILQYKADVATSKGTISNLKDAKDYLAEAARLDLDDLKIDLINQKIKSINDSIADLEAKQIEAAAAALPNE